MPAQSQLVDFPGTGGRIPVPRTRHDVIRLLAHNIRALDALARQVVVADLVNEEKLNLLEMIKGLVADTAAEMTKLEHRGDLAAELVPQIRALVHLMQEQGLTSKSIP
ncbi:hypothetical protein [Phreatobacter sp.]|uniref:hypothetical protein n=1 Tax=Phreatobacter sp. TaxID=1966341 RepID=UPI0022CA872A|nr:hypothetical protein [Phreatobacter sp.]MCZ8314327.1 hypothetical protein [Phreatobacter sp.]